MWQYLTILAVAIAISSCRSISDEPTNQAKAESALPISNQNHCGSTSKSRSLGCSKKENKLNSKWEFFKTLKPVDVITDFTSDGCSNFPDKFMEHDWTHCCVVHDVAYWMGGKYSMRQAADDELEACVEKTTNNVVLPKVMWTGVLFGGAPHSVMPYRWGYGWRYYIGYDQMNKKQVNSVKQKYKFIVPYIKTTFSLGSDQLHYIEQKVNEIENETFNKIYQW